MTSSRITELRAIVRAHAGHKSAALIDECLDTIEKLQKALATPRTRQSPNRPINGDAYHYGEEIGLPKDQVEAFTDHFDANGWKIGGKTPMKCWRAAMRTWKRNAARFSPPVTGKPDAAPRENETSQQAAQRIARGMGIA